ncbi:hypothetical protein [Streptomyces sp. NPDC020951]|uniref:hypothetical protein n=1 Tax=Streptomyces sp. NPDC020951 TaxID=3365104 RepID=UPI00379FFBCC
MKSLFVSYMRTLVPYGVALVLTGTGWLGIPVDSTAAAGAVSLGLGAAYYAAFRGLEALAERMAWRPLQLAAGAFLGWARPPAYEKDAAVPLRFTIDKDHLDRETRAALAALKRATGGGR